MNSLENQVIKAEKSVTQRNISLGCEFRPTQQFLDSPSQYIDSYRGRGKRIFDYLHSFRRAKFISLKNETIAKEINCSIRTVQRWTKRFMMDGLIEKTQSHSYSPNHYNLAKSMRGQRSYEIMLTRLNPKQLGLYISTGKLFSRKDAHFFRVQTVTLTKSLNINKNFIYKKPIPVGPFQGSTLQSSKILVTGTDKNTGSSDRRKANGNSDVLFKPRHVCKLDAQVSGSCSESIFSSKNLSKESLLSYSQHITSLKAVTTRDMSPSGIKRRQQVGRVIGMLSDKDKNWIIENKNKPNIKAILARPNIEPYLFTQCMKDAQVKFKMREWEAMKLVAFPDHIVKRSYDDTYNLVYGPNQVKMRNAGDYIISECVNHCRAENIEPEWQWFYMLCEIFNLKNPGKIPKPQFTRKTYFAQPMQSVTSKTHQGISPRSEQEAAFYIPKTKEQNIIDLRHEISRIDINIQEIIKIPFGDINAQTLRRKRGEMVLELESLLLH